MKGLRSAAQEAAEDIFFGQLVIIVARWFLILAITILVLWNANTVNEITINILLVVVLMAMNFYLHGRYLVEQPANYVLTTAASLLDLCIVTAIILIWPGKGELTNPFFVLYYPILLAFAFVFPTRLTMSYTLCVLVAFAAASYLTALNPLDSVWLKALTMRLITLTATAGLGMFYWRIQRARRRAALNSFDTMQLTSPNTRVSSSLQSTPSHPA
jgi:hypothetical protein